MITNESEIRIALLAVLATILGASDNWGCAAFVVLMMLPWKPIFAVGWYLAQPLVDWRARKARAREERGISHMEQELDVLLRDAKLAASAPASKRAVALDIARFDPVKAAKPDTAVRSPLPKPPQAPDHLAAMLAIPPAIQTHVRNLPQGAFSNMDLEVEEVKFQGDLADAYVRFKSSNVSGLVIRQRYHLRRSGDAWEVESRQPANGSSHEIPPLQAPGPPEIRPS
jgi:hypothetical protein